jgi:hypothetical protein
VSARTDHAATRWVVRDVAQIDVATADRAARSQASLADGLALLRSVRFSLLPAPVEPATGDRAAAHAAHAAHADDAVRSAPEATR